MPMISIVPDGIAGGCLAAELNGKKLHHVTGAFTVAGVPGGMESGKASVALVIPLPDGSVVFCETSLALFVAASRALVAKHGEP